MPLFEDIYQAAISQDADVLRQFDLFDRVLQQTAPFVTVAGLLARQNNVQAVKFLQKTDPNIRMSYIAEGFAYAGNHDMVRECEEAGAFIGDIVVGYAGGNHHSKAEEYLYKALTPDAVDKVVGIYAEAGNSAQIKYYQERYQTNLVVIARGYARGGHHTEAEACLDEVQEQQVRAELINELAWVYAMAGNHERVRHYEVNHGANQNNVIRAYAMAGHDEAVEALLQPGDHITSLAKNAAWGYAFLGNHSKVEDLLARYPGIDLEWIVDGYNLGGFGNSAAYYQAQLVGLALIKHHGEAEDVLFSSDEHDDLVSGGEGDDADILGAHVGPVRLQQSPADASKEAQLLDAGNEERYTQTPQLLRLEGARVSVASYQEHQADDLENETETEPGSEFESDTCLTSDGEDEPASEHLSQQGIHRASEGNTGGNKRQLGTGIAENEVFFHAGGLTGVNSNTAQDGQNNNELGRAAAPEPLRLGLANNSIPARTNQDWLDGINLHVLSLFVAGIGATAVAAAVVALALQAVTFPVGMAIVAVGGVTTALGGFGFFKYAPELPAEPATLAQNQALGMG